MKKYYQRTIVIFLTSLIITLLAACSTAPLDTPGAKVVSSDTISTDVPQQNDGYQPESTEIEQGSNLKQWGDDASQIDEQGAVVVEVIPINPNNPGETLDFQVALNTHSVDLGMDLASLATLETDTGHIVQATLWDASLGGHHVSGILSFPAGVDGMPLLEGVSEMTIRLIDVDSPERIFRWER